MWEPEILRREEDTSLIWIAAPFEMPRISGALIGRTLLIDGVPHRVETTMAAATPRNTPIAKGERISLRVRPLETGD
ncbi:hypothetical protein ADL19_32825 [Streptomyces purpurogeneiscleroticus]|nr:hypothetical protein ADL19_32825 [Streptomyces purpurogeneiscleroticus]